MNLLALSPPRSVFRHWPHLLGLIILTLILIGSFLNPPGLGDDATYWRLADRANERGLEVFTTAGFHPLRWPVWGICLISQWISGPGLANYYAVPFFYLTLGSVFAFSLAWRFTGRLSVAWLAGICFVMHPLLNSICYRPMPDLSEGIFVGAAFWLWFRWISADSPKTLDWLSGIGAGLVIGLAHSNRFTGLLTIPLLIAATLILYPKRSLRLLPVFAATALFILAEGWMFKIATGDFWHSFTANLSARGRKGTEEIALWEFPFRFFGALWNVADMEPFFFLSSVAGGVLFWIYGNKAHRAQVLWCVQLYLGYSCAIQSLTPPQPMLRDGPRFLSSLALPMSVLGAAGIFWGLQSLIARLPARWKPQSFIWKPLGWIALLVVLVTCTERTFTQRGYVTGLQAQLNDLPDGSLVVSHDQFKPIAKMVAGEKYSKLRWETYIDILTPGEVKVDEAAAIMYCRKQMWLRRRKLLEKKEEPENNQFPEFFDRPWEKWTLKEVLLESGNSDFVFLQRRKPTDAPAQVWENGALPQEFLATGIKLPLKEKGKSKEEILTKIKIPQDWRGKHIWIDVVGSADTYEPLNDVNLTWLNQNGDVILKQSESLYFHDKTGHDFHAIAIPLEAVQVELRCDRSGKAKRLEIDQLRVYLQK